ncbi:MAG: ATPase [Saprospiraceae bacterium]|nr:ATPase [Saprospiraceae bacterium]
MQIDLIIDRKDNVINLCEIKFSLGKYKMTKKYASEIQNKVNSFIANVTSQNKAIFPTIITTYGLETNIHNGIFVNEVYLDDIFLDF